MTTRDLIILVPDKNTEYAIRGAVGRHSALGVRPLQATTLVEPGRDGGVRTRGPQVLTMQRRIYGHALLILDHEGSGSDLSPTALEASLDRELGVAWGDDAKAIVVHPEIDVWMWGVDSHLREVLNWRLGASPREWLQQQGFKFSPVGKPLRPKEALERLFEVSHLPRSSRTYEFLTRRLSLARCQDPAFVALRITLQRWFPPLKHLS